jgi:hypothetical protein
MLDSDVSNSEIKSLLILLLLKSGTTSDEIQTALQMARVSRFMAESDHDEEPAPSPRQPAPRVPRITPKQVVRNTHLAPIKGYYAA